MKPVSYVRPVTVIHEQFTPSLHVQRALEAFTTDTTSSIHLHATGHRIVDQFSYHHSAYDQNIKAVQERLRTLGRRGVTLSGATRIVERNNGAMRLLIQPGEQAYLDNLVEELKQIPSLEMLRPAPQHFYIDFAKGALIRSVEEQRRAMDLFSVRARHPATQRLFTANTPTIVARDFMAYAYTPPETEAEESDDE